MLRAQQQPTDTIPDDPADLPRRRLLLCRVVRILTYAMFLDGRHWGMTKDYLASLSGTLFSGDQRHALDAIGAAFKRKAITFRTAAELSDLVKGGRSKEALERLAQAKT